MSNVDITGVFAVCVVLWVVGLKYPITAMIGGIVWVMVWIGAVITSDSLVLLGSVFTWGDAPYVVCPAMTLIGILWLGVGVGLVRKG